MNCNEFEQLLSSMLDGVRDPRWCAAAAHADGCARCREYFERFQVLEQAIAGWRTAVPEVDLTERILAGLHPPLTPRPPRSTSPLIAETLAESPRRVALAPVAPAPVAARAAAQRSGRLAMLTSFLALVSLVCLLLPRGTPPETPQRVAESTTSPGRQGRQQTVAWSTLVVEAEDACRTLAADALASVRDVTPRMPSPRFPPARFWPAQDAGRGMSGPDRRVDEHDHGDEHDDGDGAGVRLSESLQPIQRDLTKAVGFLWNAVPGAQGTSL